MTPQELKEKHMNELEALRLEHEAELEVTANNFAARGSEEEKLARLNILMSDLIAMIARPRRC